MLALTNPDAPPGLLLRAYLENRDHDRRRIVDRDGFPDEGLARFADDPDPAVRRLGPRDRAAPTELIERLLRDPDDDVRQAAAS